MSEDFIPKAPNPAIPGSVPPNKEVPAAPPPWTLKAKTWTFVYSPSDDKGGSEPLSSLNLNNSAEILQDLLIPGSYHPMEVIHPDALRKLDNGQPQLNGYGSLVKVVMIVRYEETEVGPYDEIMLIPGFFVNPHTGKRHARISNIYVSTDASVWNGRRNWSKPFFLSCLNFEGVR